MIIIALCGVLESFQKFHETLDKYISGDMKEYKLINFDSVEQAVISQTTARIFILDKKDKDHAENKLRDFIKSRVTSDNKKTYYNFMIFISNPINDEDCLAAIESMMPYLQHESMDYSLRLITQQGLRNIPIPDIYYLEYNNRKIIVVTEGETFITYDKMKNMLPLLPESDFDIPHKSFIVHFKSIASIKNYEIKMCDGTSIPLSQKRGRLFRRKYDAYLQRHTSKLTTD